LECHTWIGNNGISISYPSHPFHPPTAFPLRTIVGGALPVNLPLLPPLGKCSYNGRVAVLLSHPAKFAVVKPMIFWLPPQRILGGKAPPKNKGGAATESAGAQV